MIISSIKGRQIFDSRGFPTVECDVILDDGTIGRAAVPSGASTGSSEALELRDGGDAFGGKGVTKAVDNIQNIIAPNVIGKSADDQALIDQTMLDLDGTDNKSNLGANATLAVSLAVANAAAKSLGVPLYRHVANLAGESDVRLPMPMLNILNGGKHADGSTDIQEFMVMPVGASTFDVAMRMSSEIYHHLGKVLRSNQYSTTVGDEGGYAPSLHNGTNEALDLIIEAINLAGYQPGRDVVLALDVAASELYENGIYNFARANATYTTEQIVDMYQKLVEQFPIVSIEDGLDENDWAGWGKLCQLIGDKTQLVGDDLLVTNTRLLDRAIKENSANAILIKPNQIGTLTETMQAIQMAKKAGWRTVMSHRSGETEDVTISHLAVGFGTGQIKTGSFSRSDRIAKYNELIRISESLGGAELKSPFAAA